MHKLKTLINLSPLCVIFTSANSINETRSKFKSCWRQTFSLGPGPEKNSEKHNCWVLTRWCSFPEPQNKLRDLDHFYDFLQFNFRRVHYFMPAFSIIELTRRSEFFLNCHCFITNFVGYMMVFHLGWIGFQDHLGCGAAKAVTLNKMNAMFRETKYNSPAMRSMNIQPKDCTTQQS